VDHQSKASSARLYQSNPLVPGNRFENAPKSGLVALKRPTVAPTEGLLTEAVLKHVRVLPNRRLFGVASRNPGTAR
jgi:hypothetical protein